MAALFAFIGVLFLCFDAGYSIKTIDLNGQWIVSNANGSYSVPGTVPGSMYTALMSNNKIGDPYYRKNDEALRWIGQDDWTFTRQFTVESDVLNSPAVILVCEGLDTISTIEVNNKTIGKSKNMFVRYVFDVKSALKEGENTIRVSFRSAVQYAQNKALQHSYPVPPVSKPSTFHGENHVGINTITIQFESATEYVKAQAVQRSYPILPLCVPPEYHGECGANLIRKMQCSFSWDWGPSFPTQGIWKDIYIKAYDTAIMMDVTAETIKHKDGSWVVKVDVFPKVKDGPKVQSQFELKFENITLSRSVELSSTTERVTFNVTIPKTMGIKEWWPNGYGNQTLYDLYVFYTDSFGTMNNKKVRIGFRTVEIVQDYVSVNKTKGRTFYFRINGQAIFLKGSNWIPADSFLERVTRDRVYNYLKSAADVHMNSMRVWGGGIYEFDMFYEIADELGIMIWQDFMFACAMYPADDDFLSSVKDEVRHQVRRLKHHPSVIVLSGNNENEKALVQDWYGTDVNFTRYKNDYLKLYKDTIYSVVQEEDTSTPFIASSPSNGIETIEEGWVAKQPYSTLYGDVHEYKYLVPFFDPNQYSIPRLSSEFGLQSFPSYEALQTVYNDTDMDYWSDMNDYRNHHPFGNIEMMAEAIQYVKLPNKVDRRERFKDLIYITQIDQAIGMKTETEHLRRWQNRLDNDGQGNTMGALYWMLADIWQAPTWASLEYGGKWKMLHYFAKQFFSPTLISPVQDGNMLDVYVILDELPVKEWRHPVDHTLQFHPRENPRPFSMWDVSTWHNFVGNGQTKRQLTPRGSTLEFTGNLYIEIYSWDNMTPLKTWKIPFTVNSTAQSVYRHNLGQMVTSSGCIRSKACFIAFHFGNTSGPTNWMPLSQFNNAEGLQKANIKITNVQATSKPNEFTLTLTTDAVAPFVWVDTIHVKGRFSDNGFLMYQKTMTLTFYAWETVDVNTLTNSLSVKSLMDVYE